MTSRISFQLAALAQTTRDLQRDLTRSAVPAHAIEAPSRPGEKGDAFSFGQLALDLVTSGAVTALVECLKAYLARDRTLSFTLKRPDGTDLEVMSHNIDTSELCAELRAFVPKD